MAVLYLMYTADLSEAQNVLWFTFADDTAALTCNLDDNTTAQLQNMSLRSTSG